MQRKIILTILILILLISPATVMAVTEEEAIANQDLQYYRLGKDLYNLPDETGSAEEDNIAYENYYLSAPSVTHDSKFASYDKYDGVDVSYYQSTIDFNKVKADGVDFVILRAGYRGYGNGTLVTDTKFTTYAKQAKAAGLDIGVYFYTQAISATEAKEEAQYVAKIIKDYSITLPVAYDIENYPDSYGARMEKKIATFKTTAEKKTFCTSLCTSFCQEIEKQGYKGMVYANKYWLTDLLYNKNISDNYQVWLAHYISKTNYTGVYNYWQCSSTAKVKGISTNVDYNFLYAKAPVAVKNLQISEKSKTTLTASWDKSVRANGYKVLVTDKNGNMVVSATTNSQQYKITGLVDGKDYIIEITPFLKLKSKTYYATPTAINTTAGGSTVTLNKSILTLGIGETYNLSAAVTAPEDGFSFSFKSGNSAIATVSGTGKVTAKGEGTAYITVTDTVGKGSAICTVTVKKAPLSVTLNKDCVVLDLNKTAELTSYVASGYASNARSYVSSNTAVATVTKSGGTITAKGYGETFITVSTFNNKTAKCKVIVSKAPNISSIETINGKIKLTWDKMAGVSGYKVYRSTSQSSGYYLIFTTANDSYTNSAVTLGKRYYYKVAPTYKYNNKTYEGSTSNWRSYVSMKTPVITSISVDDGKIKLAWDKVAGADKYNIYRSTDAENYTLISTITSTTATNVSVKQGLRYYYKIEALSTSTGSNYKSALSKWKSRVALKTPAISKISGANGLVTLNWNEIEGADKYNIYRSTDGKTFTYLKSSAKTTGTDDAVTQGARYYYRIVAVSTRFGANYIGAYSKWRSAVPLKTPNILTATNSGSKMALTFGKVEGADKYYIYISTNGTDYTYKGSTTKLYYTATNLTKGQKYYCKISAVKVIGTTKFYSLKSNPRQLEEI
jgi:fibronectin type 3 domain-containing protein/GH25 family lysozyme M1 (1,4-beta-N-acetylmuramidase)